LERGQYKRLANPLALKLDKKVPLELYEARNAVQIARAIGADRFASETFQKAEKSLAQAEAYQDRKAGTKPVTMTAREAVQTAEDARAIAVKRQEEQALAEERQQATDREQLAKDQRAAAQLETERVTREADAARLQAQAEADRLTREKAQQAEASVAEAGRVKRDNDIRSAMAEANADRLRIEGEARTAAATTEANRLKQENEAQRLESEARATAAAAEANRLKQENEAQRLAGQAALDAAAKQRILLEAEKVELRARLLAQFNAILQTRDTARGLIVNMSDVLFDTGKYSLRPLAREKLANVAGIVAGHPGLKLDVEGHTDSVGGEEYNQKLSEQRSSTVREYLTGHGMQSAAVTSKGFGKSQPVASNDSASGRQQNRRVELVISGDVIGTEIGTPRAAR
jgi:outer membrane protein OmpA-like peptidoglycan-associated protein